MKKYLIAALVAVVPLVASAQFCKDATGRCQTAALTGGTCPAGWTPVASCGGTVTPTPTPAPTPVPTAAPTKSLVQIELGGEWYGVNKPECGYIAKNCKEKIATTNRTACIYLPNGAILHGYTLQSSVKRGGPEVLYRLLYNSTGLLDDGCSHIDAPRHHPPMTCSQTIVVPRTLAYPVVIPPGTYIWWAGLYCGDGSAVFPVFETAGTLDFEATANLVVQRVPVP